MGWTAAKVSRIRRIEALPHIEYVYDLSTENHHFQAGLGNMIVHNTDSVFVKLAPTIAESIRLGKHASLAITRMLDAPPIELEYEKVNCPMILLKKKKYISTVYKNDPDVPCGRDSKGVVSVRGDICELTKDVYRLMVDEIISSRNMNAVFRVVGAYLDDMLALRLPVRKFAQRIKYNPPYKGKAVQQLIANKILDRTGSLPEPSDIFMVVYVKNDTRGLSACDKAEDLTWFETHSDLKLDMPYYILNKIEKPLSDVMNLLPGDHMCEQFFDRYLPPEIVARRVKARIARLKRKRVAEDEGTCA